MPVPRVSGSTYQCQPGSVSSEAGRLEASGWALRAVAVAVAGHAWEPAPEPAPPLSVGLEALPLSRGWLSSPAPQLGPRSED
jgi:hypothetical protein